MAKSGVDVNVLYSYVFYSFTPVNHRLDASFHSSSSFHSTFTYNITAGFLKKKKCGVYILYTYQLKLLPNEVTQIFTFKPKKLKKSRTFINSKLLQAAHPPTKDNVQIKIFLFSKYTVSKATTWWPKTPFMAPKKLRPSPHKIDSICDFA